MPEIGEPGRCRVLVIGGYGVFGGRLARRLMAQDEGDGPGIDVLVGGRSLLKAREFCAEHGGLPVEIDTGGDIGAVLRDLRPTIVIDAAGPFQAYGNQPYRVTQAAIEAGAHYLDLADDTAFVGGIGVLDAAARAQGVTALSGCSSVPAISAAAVRSLARDLVSIDGIVSCIVPGNRAPRGRSVVAAILAQVGRPIDVWWGGRWRTIHGWCDVSRYRASVSGVAPLVSRWTSPIGAPDLALFPERFGARTVRFRAGLELGVMHFGLAAIAWAVRLGVLRSAVGLTTPLLWVAERLERFGTDRGGMTVEVVGRDSRSRAWCRRWTLIADAGDGPQIPPTPAYVLARRLCQFPDHVVPGARACVDELTLEEIEAGFGSFKIATEVAESEMASVFEAALGDRYKELPPPLRILHDVLDTRVFVGSAMVERGTGWLARLIGWGMGFPPAGDETPVRVEMRRTKTGEVWCRRFGASPLRSTLRQAAGARPGEIWERFGVFSFRIDLAQGPDELHYPVGAARVFGVIPVPRFLLPISQTREFVDDNGNAAFDVSVSVPFAGFIVRYQGWLKPVQTLPNSERDGASSPSLAANC